MPTSINRLLRGAALCAFACLGCIDEPSASTSAAVFLDDFGDVEYQAFLGSKYDALSQDTVELHAGRAALRIVVPGPKEAGGAYAGGAFVSRGVRDLSGYDALTFWAKSSQDVTLDVIGLGNDNTGASKLEASTRNVALTSTWTKLTLPLPLPSRLTAERGLFFFAAAPQGSPATGYIVWLDDIQFEKLGAALGPARPQLKIPSLTRQTGDAIVIPGTGVTFAVDGADVALSASSEYFSFRSSDPAVVRFEEAARGKAMGAGNATVTAALGEVEAEGSTLVHIADVPGPTSAPPTPPSRAPASVISLLGSAYPNVGVDSWMASYSQADAVFDVTVGGEPVKKYEGLRYAAVELVSKPLDATAMATFHLDLWTPESKGFQVKLVDFGPDGAYGGGDDSEGEVILKPGGTPALTPSTWLSLDLPLSAFSGLSRRAHVAQIILSGSNSTAYVANVHLHN